MTENAVATDDEWLASVLPPKEIELLSIALDASFAHMFAPGTRRHIHNALKAGATMEDIFEVLKLRLVQAV
jgi:alkylhydroperoxidase/carboxymuconolactone decarboxylase family protein YurZ